MSELEQFIRNRSAKFIVIRASRWYEGRPVMIARNDSAWVV